MIIIFKKQCTSYRNHRSKMSWNLPTTTDYVNVYAFMPYCKIQMPRFTFICVTQIAFNWLFYWYSWTNNLVPSALFVISLFGLENPGHLKFVWRSYRINIIIQKAIAYDKRKSLLVEPGLASNEVEMYLFCWTFEKLHTQ